MQYQGGTDEYFEVVELTNHDYSLLSESKDGQMTMVWFQEGDNRIKIDTIDHIFNKNEITCLTSFHNVEIENLTSARLIRFNRPFYCILDHDSDVGCKGVLFFGSKNLPVIKPSKEDLELLGTVWKMLIIEMKSTDNLQLEMLQMMLKRILILCTRIYRSQTNLDNLKSDKVDIVRDFNFLVEQHFKEKHTVAEYAQLLNKSPKTLSNIFGKLSDKTPLQLIQGRIMLEVRRMLRYTDKPISEIGYEVGFNEIQSFSRFFKKNEGVSPSEFRVA